MKDEQMKREMALFRFSLIAPVVAGTYQQASKMDYYKETCAKEHLLPNGKLVKFSPLTLKKWYWKYTDGGLEALIPQARMDLGKSRALTEDVCRQIHAYREKFPYITGKKIHEKLIAEGYTRNPRTLSHVKSETVIFSGGIPTDSMYSRKSMNAYR